MGIVLSVSVTFQIFAVKFWLGEIATVNGIADDVLVRTSAICCLAAS